jgi:hypothetical protein
MLSLLWDLWKRAFDLPAEGDDPNDAKPVRVERELVS